MTDLLTSSATKKTVLAESFPLCMVTHVDLSADFDLVSEAHLSARDSWVAVQSTRLVDFVGIDCRPLVLRGTWLRSTQIRLIGVLLRTA